MKFEYKQIEFNLGIMRGQKKQDELHELLNELGWEGWELVGFVSIGDGSRVFEYVFKRQKLNEF